MRIGEDRKRFPLHPTWQLTWLSPWTWQLVMVESLLLPSCPSSASFHSLPPSHPPLILAVLTYFELYLKTEINKSKLSE